MTAQDILNAATLDNYGSPKPLIRLDAYTFPGCYPIVYYTLGNDTLCADCATKEIRAWMYGESDDPPTMYDVYLEGADDNCADCNKVIESAYGDPWAAVPIDPLATDDTLANEVVPHHANILGDNTHE